MLRLLAVILVPAAVLAGQSPSPASKPPLVSAADLAGAWAGTASHDGETTPVAIELEPGGDGKILIKMSAPVVHLRSAPLGRVTPQEKDGKIVLGPFTFAYDAASRTLRGDIPEGLAPVYRVPMTLQRVDRLDLPPRAEPEVPVEEPAWTFEAHAPLWPGTTFVDGTVYAGGEDGQMHALDAGSGRPRWTFAAGGPIRSRAAVARGSVYFQADDGFLYALEAASGRERWRVRVVATPVVRLPPGDPKSRFDRFASDVTIVGDRLYVGGHDGRLLCLEAAHGRTLWQFASADSVLAAPAVEGGRVYFGSYDGRVYALDAGSGRELWRHDTGKPVVSTPAVYRDRVVVGSRSYDLLGLEAGTGAVAWKRYIWFSWVESSPVVRDGIAYVGSSDAAALYAFDARTGRSVWKTDVWGWAWGQPAVTDRRVYMGTSALGGYLVGHRAGIMAVERATGAPAWRHLAPPAAADKAYGFTGSASVGAGRVYVAGLDGKVYAFAE